MTSEVTYTNRPKVLRLTVFAAALFGIATLLLGVTMLFVFPSSADLSVGLSTGFRTPIVAFEFARSDADLAFLSGGSGAAVANRNSMDAGHRWDTVFPFAYAGFVALLLLQLVAQGQRWLWLAVVLALGIIPLDLRENAVLVAITEALRHDASTTILLQKLHTATWLKWGALGVSIAALSVGLWLQRAYALALLAALTALAFALCWLTDARPLVAEIMTGTSSVLFLVFTIRAVIQAWKYTGTET